MLHQLAFMIAHEDLHHNVNVNICHFAIFVPIFIKFSLKCRANFKKMGML